MEALLNIGESHDGSGYLVRVSWSGFEEDEDTREPLKTLWEDAPQFVKQQLKKIKLGRDVHGKFHKTYGITVSFTLLLHISILARKIIEQRFVET